MANSQLAKIPLKNIEKIEIYINNKKKTLAQIKNKTGADYIINGGLFNGDWTPCPLLKVDGTMISKAPYSMWGYGWRTGPDIEMSNAHKNFTNYIGSIDLINPVEKTKTDLNYGSDFVGKRGRSAMGLTKDSLVLYCTKDGSSGAMIMEELQADMFKFGCETAIMLDGGGSSQCDFDGKKITSTRRVHNLILVYCKKTQIVDAEEECSVNVKYLKKGATGSAVKSLQILLIGYGYSCGSAGADGSFGSGTDKAVRAYQKDNGLATDGSVGPATWEKLLGTK